MKRFLGIMLVCALCIALGVLVSGEVAKAEVVKSGTCGTNLTWELDNEGVLTISGTGMMTSHPWTASSIKSIIINDGVTSIGSSAFCDCSSLTCITIPNSVTSIGSSAFRNCSSLTSITIPNGVTSIGSSAFYDCSGLTSVMITNSVTSIGEWAFYSCRNLTNVTIPDGVTTIGQSTFYNCSSLMSVTIPDSVTSIGYSAFQGCSGLTSITLSNSVTDIDQYAFQGCSGLTSITLPNSVTIIGGHAFDGCSRLMGINIPEDVTEISNGTFYNCSKLRSVTIPEGVTSIGDYAFYSCNGLSSITIPESVTSINNAAFYNCSRLTNIAIPKSVTSISDYAFYSCSDLSNITVPESVTSIGYAAFYNCSGLSNITIPESVTSIGDYVFSSCNGLTSITLPEGVVSIGNSVFSNCIGLTNITIPESVASIGDNAFLGCSRLTSITIPDGVISIGKYAFLSCSAVIYANLDSDGAKAVSKSGFSFRDPGNNYNNRYIYTNNEITGLEISGVDKDIVCFIIPEDVTSIGDYAFENCTGLTNITMSESITSIGNQAFSYCDSLEKVCILGETTTFGSNLFSGSPTIYCYEFSDAEGWANENGYHVELLDNIDIDSIREISLPGDMWLACGKTIAISAGLFPNDGTEIVWTSSDPDVASVDGSGKVSALSKGTATITASAGGASDSMEIEVYIAPESFELDTVEAWLVAKEGLRLSIVNIEPDGAEVDPVWTSSDTAIATVDNGLVTTKKPGDVTITATSDGISRECLIHLFYPVTAIAFEQNEIELAQGQSFQLTANVTARTQATVNRLMTFESSNPSVATVDEGGVVTAHDPGTATITATAASGVTASCEVLVHSDTVLMLPAGLTAIEDEAFMNDLGLIEVIVPDGCASIGERAFAGCANLVYVRIPAALTDIAGNAFEGCGDVRIARDGE